LILFQLRAFYSYTAEKQCFLTVFLGKGFVLLEMILRKAVKKLCVKLGFIDSVGVMVSGCAKMLVFSMYSFCCTWVDLNGVSSSVLVF